MPSEFSISNSLSLVAPQVQSATDLYQSSETLVVLCEGNGEVPLIIIHGAEGSIAAFSPLQKSFKTALWAIQHAPGVRFGSLEEQIALYHNKITERRPKGPYRLASFSASSAMLVALAHIFEQVGEVIQQLSFIDNFPAIHYAPGFGAELLTQQDGRQRCLDNGFDIIIGLTRRDGGGNNPKRHIFSDALEAARRDPATNAPQTAAFLGKVLDYMSRFVDSFYARDLEGFVEWTRSIKAPITVYVATEGTISHLQPKDRKDWYGYGVHRCFPDAKVVTLNAGHYDILSMVELIEGLQTEVKMDSSLRSRL